jgi:hypothetical protein
MKTTLSSLWILLVASQSALAVTNVNPNGVNVRSSGTTTVFLTFQGLDPEERAIEALWCGAVQPGVVGGSVTASDPCVPGTIFGRLPLRLDRSQPSASGSLANLTDVMTIPASVARRAYQAAAAGAASDFFYVRRFSGGAGGDRWVTVTCRMAGGGARSPLALLDVRIGFANDDVETTSVAIARDSLLPNFGARIQYNGTGRLIGRWELVQPGDIEPEERDLLTEATLPVEQRGTQRRYTLIQRFDRFLLPDGEVFLPGPDPRLLPTQSDGEFQVLLRIEASAEKEGLSNTGANRLVASGGVAGFALPRLRYYVGAAAPADGRTSRLQQLDLLAPADGHTRPSRGELRLAWQSISGAAFYRVEFADAERPIAQAFVASSNAEYLALADMLGSSESLIAWRVLALDDSGHTIARSGWRRLRAPL